MKRWMLPRAMVQYKLLKNFTGFQSIEDKRGDVMDIGEDWDMLIEQLKTLQQRINEERGK